jgi:hypothetical protein
MWNTIALLIFLSQLQDRYEFQVKWIAIRLIKLHQDFQQNIALVFQSARVRAWRPVTRPPFIETWFGNVQFAISKWNHSLFYIQVVLTDPLNWICASKQLWHLLWMTACSYFGRNFLAQCCATFLHSRQTKYCRRVMAAHQPLFCILWEEGGGEMVYGIDWPRQLLINRPQSKNVLFDVHNYPSLLLCHLFQIYSLF